MSVKSAAATMFDLTDDLSHDELVEFIAYCWTTKQVPKRSNLKSFRLKKNKEV